MSAPGKDQIQYIMLSNLNERSKEILLELYNKVWERIVKDCTNPGNYRPIALTSNICKIMEKMINERLTYYMENKGHISKTQSGFRRGRNTLDPVLCLEHDIRKAQVNRESCGCFLRYRKGI